VDAGDAVKAVEGYLGDSDDVAAFDDAVISHWRKLANNSGGQAIGFLDGATAVLETAIDADKQLITGKGVHPAVITQNAPRTAVRG
jgi:hypothetical protein